MSDLQLQIFDGISHTNRERPTLSQETENICEIIREKLWENISKTPIFTYMHISSKSYVPYSSLSSVTNVRGFLAI